MRLLLADDDGDLREFVREGLLREGFAVDVAGNGARALELALGQPYDVMLLDVMMPELDGLAVLKRLRQQGYRGAILLVTCKGLERDKVEGLNSGADDYVVKPFLLSELIARVRAVIRRMTLPPIVKGYRSPAGAVLAVGNLSMDVSRRECRRGDKLIPLTKKEFDLLECFMRRPGEVLSQAVITQQVFHADFHTTSNTVEVHIKNLRSKLDINAAKSVLRTVRGCGYALEV